MRRLNAGLSPTEHELPPNGIYEAYRNLLDSIFILERIPDDDLEDLFVFERADLAQPRFTPPGWQGVELVSDPVLEQNIEWQEFFGVQEKELFSFLLVDVPDNGKLLRIVGDVGTGKSTFVRYMFLRYLPRQPYFAEHRFIHVDLQRVLRTQKEYSYDRTVRIALREIKQVLVNGIGEEPDYRRWSDEHVIEYLRKEVERLGTNRVIIIFDNVDPFPISFQSSLGNFCQSLSNSALCTVAVVMRPINWAHFSRQRHAGANVVYDLPQRPPAAHKVVECRLRHCLKTRQDLRPPRRLRVSKNEFTVSFSDLEEFIQNFVKLVLHEHVRNALKSLTNGNIRLALIWTIDFISSWNLNVPYLVERVFQAAALSRPIKAVDEFDTFILAIGYCNHDVYFRKTSRLDNLFSASVESGSGHTLVKYRCLKYCSQNKTEVSKEELTAHLESFGYGRNEIAATVNTLLSIPRILLKSSDGDRYENVHALGITPAGYFYLDTLVEHMYYLQLISDDMVLPDDIRPNQGSKIKRLGDLVRLIDFMGGIEFAEIERFIVTGQQRPALRQTYLEIYGPIPLCVKMLEGLARFTRGRTRQSGGGGDLELLAHEVNGLIRGNMRRYNRALNGES